MTPQRFDIVIVGAGLAGSALAAALGASPLRVALLEMQPLSLDWPQGDDSTAGFDTRVSALTAASREWLEQLGAWQAVAQRRLSPYRHMHVWDGEGTGAIDFDAAEVNQPALGYIVENRLLQTSLLHCVSRQHNVQVFSPIRVTGFARTDAGIVVSFEDGRQLLASLLVAADGANSRVRDWAGFDMREWDYGHNAIVATVATELPHEGTAWQVFRREGPLAFLPLRTADGGQHLSSIVWSTVPDEAAGLMQKNDEDFRQALGAAFESRLGAITGVSRRQSFPLRARHARRYTQPNIALIGDAAHTIHPLAGQGINLGLLDAQVLAEELLRAQRRGLPADDESALARYQRRRKGDNLLMLGLMEGFKRLFASTDLPVRWLRNAGLRQVDRFAPAKRLLIRQAMGLQG